MALILTFSYGNIIATKTHASSPIWFLSFAEMVPQACLWCLRLFPTLDWGVALFGQPLSPNREAGWGFLTEKQVKNRLSNHLGIIVFVTDRQAGTFSERNR